MNYQIKKLIEGYKLGYAGKTLIAVPDNVLGKGDLQVIHKNENMVIKKGVEPITYRVFEDKFGRKGNYTLCYYEWCPTSGQIALL